MAGSSAGQKHWKTLGALVGALVAAAVLTAGLLLPYVGGLGMAARHEAGKFLDTACNLQESQPPQKTTLYAKDGTTVLATLFSQDRVPVPLSEVPKYLQDALVATEDRRFYSHHGVDMRGLLRSAVSTTGGDTQGGSTLTMQYVKQVRYYQAGTDVQKQQAAIEQNLNRKIEDAKCAIYIENTEKESKDTILDNYLNIAFFGENAYGIQTAAGTYFNKPASQLTLPESALLVGLLRAPTEYDPFVHPDAAKTRRNQVLQNLVDVGKLSQSEADTYKATPVSLGTQSPPLVKEGCANAPASITNVAFFCEYTKDWLEKVGGISSTQLLTGGLKIVTTLDPSVQNSVQAGLSSAMPATSPMTAVLPVLDPKTGDILAMATNKLYGVGSSPQDNTHTSLPIFTAYTGYGASTYKLFPLLAALSTGVPSNWALATPTAKTGYVPRNCTSNKPVTNGDAQETYNSNETLASATAKSSNTYFVGLADQLFSCNLSPIVSLAGKLGLKGLQQPSGEGKLKIADTIINNQRATEMVLGDVGTSPLEIAGAYAAVANNGKFNAPAPVLSITDVSGQPIPVKRSPGVQVIDPQVAQQAVQILTGDTKAPGTSAKPFQAWYRKNASIVAGKTGTSVAVDAQGNDTSQNAALWFVGMTPNLVAASALVNFDSPNAPAAGLPGLTNPGTDAYGAYAAGVWLQAMQATLTGTKWSWPDPSRVTGSDVPNVVGQDLATAKATLAAKGYTMAQLGASDNLQCASTVPSGKVAYFAPQRAPQGATITVCPSLGVGQTVNAPPRTSTSATPGTTSSGAATPAPGTGGAGGGGGAGGPGNGNVPGNPGQGNGNH